MDDLCCCHRRNCFVHSRSSSISTTRWIAHISRKPSMVDFCRNDSCIHWSDDIEVKMIQSYEFGACGAGPNGFQAAGGAVAGTIVCQFAEPCGAIEDSLLVIGAVAVAGIDAYNIYRGRTNVADTGITSEAQQLVSSGKFPSICAVLAFLQSTTRDSARLQKIKATQKAFGCRRNSTQS